jgi:hypothetical protein
MRFKGKHPSVRQRKRRDFHNALNIIQWRLCLSVDPT